MDDQISQAVRDYRRYDRAAKLFEQFRARGLDYFSSLYASISEDMSARALAKVINEKADKGEIDPKFAKKDKFKPKKNDELFDKDKDDDGQDDRNGEFVSDGDGKQAEDGEGDDFHNKKKPVFTKDETGDDNPDDTDGAADPKERFKNLKKDGQSNDDDSRQEDGEEDKFDKEDDNQSDQDSTGTDKKPEKEPVVKERKPLSKDADKVPLGKTVVILNPKEREDDAGKVYENFKKAVSLNKVIRGRK